MIKKMWYNGIIKDCDKPNNTNRYSVFVLQTNFSME